MHRRFNTLDWKGTVARTVGVAAVIVAVFLSPTISGAVIRMPAVFGGGMVLQRGIEVPVWGWADPGEMVTVALDSQKFVATADWAGTWKVMLPASPAGGPHTLKVSGSNVLTFTNVLFGDVWVCSGQSNMQWPLSQTVDAAARIAEAQFPQIRLYTVATRSTPEPQVDLEGTPVWTACTPQTVRSFSAVAYFFGRELHQELGVPIGLINASWGGSVAEAWVRRESLYADPVLRPIIGWWNGQVAAWPEARATYDRELAAWTAAQKDASTTVPRPAEPRGIGNRDYPAGLYNAMINPIVPYAITGVIWYQGEANAARAWQYKTLFPALIRDWRAAWGQGEFPFLFVQLAAWDADRTPDLSPGALSWAELREAQFETLSAVPRTGMAVAIEIGDSADIHPRNKLDVGHRLAFAAFREAYHRPVVSSGPLYASHYSDGLAIRIRFRYTADSLLTRDGAPLTGFTIAGPDRVFHPAEARILPEEIAVYSRDITDPVAVRYGWDDFPVCNLYNSAGLPASPFRTDDWPMTTEGVLTP